MRDFDIRLALRSELEAEHGKEPDTLIVEELGLCQGDSRVDLAVVNGAINGFEIKSEKDTLARLPMQKDIYNRTLDSVTVVAGSKHLAKIEKLVPEWWGLWEAVDRSGEVQLITHRVAAENPYVDPFSLVQLLWRQETLDILTDLGLSRGIVSKPRDALWEKLVGALPLHELKAVVRSRLKARATWRSDQ